MRGVDPYAILGVSGTAGEDEVSAAYREQAKRWHPDRGGGEEAVRRMAEVNAAYDLLRAGFIQQAQAQPRPSSPPRRRTPRGAWLSDAFRKALGPELLEALTDREAVRLVTPASTWASPRAVLAVTERRLLWLLDDAPVARVRSLAFRDIATVGLRIHRPRRRAATLSLRTTTGRRHSFADLRPHTAATIERHLRDEMAHANSKTG
jgi:DnaJ-like protein